MALTLVESAKAMDPRREAHRINVVETFARETDLMMAMQWIDVPGGSYRYEQEDTLPGIAFRGVNEGYAESVGVLNPVTENLAIAGGDMDVDVALVKMHGPQVRAKHEGMKIKSLSNEIGHQMIKGDSLSNPKQFDGLQIRLVGDQLIPCDLTAPTDGGDPLSLLQLDAGIDEVDSPTHLLMSRAMRRLLNAATRGGGSAPIVRSIEYGKDAFGRQLAFYADLPILLADRNSFKYASLGFDEIGQTGSTATATSIYVLSIGDGQYIGLQNETMDVRDLGELNAEPKWRTRIEWLVGQALEHPRCASRIFGISNAALVA